MLYLQQVEAAEPEENLKLSTGGQKGELRIRPHHKTEEKMELKMHCSHCHGKLLSQRFIFTVIFIEKIIIRQNSMTVKEEKDAVKERFKNKVQ